MRRHDSEQSEGEHGFPLGADANDSLSLTRRVALGTGVAVATGAVSFEALSVQPPPGGVVPDRAATIRMRVNGRLVEVTIDARTSLLDLLRERLALTGAKKGCDHGQCGACTVHLDGQRVVSCLTLAAKADGRDVMTIEGLTTGAALHPMQQAFIDHDALQCGFCTPGQIMAAVACVREGNATSRERIRESMSGNICRCGAYVGIVAAIEDAASKMERG
jgi:xanthine dehydrogenase YagT iron-sulfur-binding subunit